MGPTRWKFSSTSGTRPPDSGNSFLLFWNMVWNSVSPGFLIMAPTMATNGTVARAPPASPSVFRIMDRRGRPVSSRPVSRVASVISLSSAEDGSS